MLYLTFFFTITLSVYAFIAMRQEQKQLMKRRIALATDTHVIIQTIQTDDQMEKKAMIGRFAGFFWNLFRRGYQRKLTAQKEARIELKLQKAGRPFGMSPVDFRLLQITLLLLLPFLFGIYAVLLKLEIVGKFVLILVGLAIAGFLPDFYLNIKIKQRSKLALRELPDVLDLLTVSLEAGLGFDSALGKLVAKKEGVLAGEFQRCLEEIRLGKTRKEALIGVRNRLDVDELKVVISSILQAEKLGVGLVQVLRVQSHEVRERRKQRAEEEAMKAPIKMLFPLILFIFPCIFIVLLGPAVIGFLQTFAK